LQKILVFLLKTFWPSSGRNSIRVAAIRSLAVYNFCKNSNTLYLFFDCFKMLHRLTQSFTLCNSSTRNSSIDFHRLDYRVGRVLSLFSSRGNWDSPNPSPAIEHVFPEAQNLTKCVYFMCLLTCTVSAYLNVQLTC